MQHVFGICEATMGPKLMNCCRPEQIGHQRNFQNAEKNSNSRTRKSPSQEAKNWRIDTRKEKLVNKFEMEGLMTQKACGTWPRRKS